MRREDGSWAWGNTSRESIIGVHQTEAIPENLTKGHVRYLESRLIALVGEAGRATLRNGTKPPPPPLPEPDRADMDFFLEQIQTVLPVLGLDVFRKLAVPIKGEAVLGEAPAPTFVLVSRSKGDKVPVRATASLVDGEFVVRQDSTGRKQRGVTNSYTARREQLVAEGKIVDHPTEPDAVLFAADVGFASPSAAAAVVLNRNSNGRVEWRVELTGQTYADWQAQQLPGSTDQGG